MLDIDSFKMVFPKSFVKKLKESLVPFDKPLNKQEIVESLYQEITKFSYNPQHPRAYLMLSKNNHVARITTTFSPKDHFLYYFCTKMIEEHIAENRVE
jgi:hypothetical protein